jgi:hypothetical protein
MAISDLKFAARLLIPGSAEALADATKRRGYMELHDITQGLKLGRNIIYSGIASAAIAAGAALIDQTEISCVFVMIATVLSYVGVNHLNEGIPIFNLYKQKLKFLANQQ